MEIFDLALSALPFEWAKFEFMRNALLASLAVSPVFALLGCMVVENRMAFLSEAIGHAALTGIAVGSLCGMAADPLWVMLAFSLALTALICFLTRRAALSGDTVVGLVMAVAVALGVVLLSRGGGFAKYSKYLVGDILTISGPEIARLAVLSLCALVVFGIFHNRIMLSSLNGSLAASRGVNAWLAEFVFASTVAVTVTVSLQWIGLLVVNALLLLPAAAARNVAWSVASHAWIAVGVGMSSALLGLVSSYYLNTASGATMVLFAAGFFTVSMFFKR